MQLKRAILVSLYLFLSLFLLNKAFAEHLITESFVLSGNSQSQVLSAYQFGQSTVSKDKKSYKLYTINYSELKHQLSIYKKIYVSGQVLHGVLMVKARPTFVD